MTESDRKLNIAIIGAGISGITAAHLLQRKHAVTLFEKNDYIGGHTHTIVIDRGLDAGTPVDTGFIVFNDKTYPHFTRLLNHLGISKSPTDMSFGYYCRKTGLAYASRGLDAFFAQRTNLFKPSHWRLLTGIIKFLRTTRSDHNEGKLGDITLGAYLRQKGHGEDVARLFVVPMAGAIWSASDRDILSFPMRTFAQFYDNHGLLSVLNHPQWYTVNGGSHAYVKEFLKRFSGTVLPESPVRSIQTNNHNVIIETTDGKTRAFDRAVLAAHADETLAMLAEPTADEKRLLSPWMYARNKTVLHTDASFMPPNKRAWASWNYVREVGGALSSPVTVTYHMNRLQRLNTSRHYFVTLNPPRPVDPAALIAAFEYTHPLLSFDAFATQRELPLLNGVRGLYFCGSYFGYGFHEDGVKSALSVAGHFGIGL